MNMLFLFKIIIFLTGGDLTSENETLPLTGGDLTSENETLSLTSGNLTSENETLSLKGGYLTSENKTLSLKGGDLTSENETIALNVSAINNIMTSKISVNESQMNESKAMNYLYGDSDFNDNDQHVDISVFEPDEVKRLFETAQSKSVLMEREYNQSRRWYYTHGFIPGPYYITKSLDFMRQSIYGTRYRLKDTKHIRKLYSDDFAYQIAILYASLMQLKIKMDNLYATLNKFDKHIAFIWFIVLYERCLAATVDANSIVERLFAMTQQSKKNTAGEEQYQEMDPPSSDKIRPKFPN